MKRKPLWRGFVLFAVAFAVIGLDRYTKYLVQTYLPLHKSWNPISWLEPIVTLTHVRNTGAAFGLFPGMGIVFIVIAVAVVVAIIIYFRQIAAASWVLQVAFGLQLGGAAGNNLIDRLIYGYVTDFIDFRVWPVFNVADMSVVAGTILLAYYALFMDRSRQSEKSLPEQRKADAEEAGKS